MTVGRILQSAEFVPIGWPAMFQRMRPAGTVLRRDVRPLEVDADDLIRADVIKQLMCFDRLEFATFSAAHDIVFGDYFADEIEKLEPLAADELVEVSDAAIRITSKGRSRSTKAG